MAIRKTPKGALPSIVQFDIPDIEATEESVPIQGDSSGLKTESMSVNLVDSYVTAYKYGREVRLPKGQLVELLSQHDENGQRVFRMKRAADYVEPEMVPCLVPSCKSRIPVPVETLAQTERLQEIGLDPDTWLKREKRRLLRDHMEAFHPSEARSFFGKED